MSRSPRTRPTWRKGLQPQKNGIDFHYQRMEKHREKRLVGQLMPPDHCRRAEQDLQWPGECWLAALRVVDEPWET